jgi:hypothetical protein
VGAPAGTKARTADIARKPTNIIPAVDSKIHFPNLSILRMFNSKMFNQIFNGIDRDSIVRFDRIFIRAASRVEKSYQCRVLANVALYE